MDFKWSKQQLMNILIVEDDKIISKQLHKLLAHEKYMADIADGYFAANNLIDTTSYALILLDWNLCDGDGLELLRELRDKDVSTPVLMLSANIAIEDRVKVLDAGADDYLCKPYSNIELLARIRALLRRENKNKSAKIIIDNIELDSISKDVFSDKQHILLTQSEFDLLELFMQNPNIVLTRYQLSEHINKDMNSINLSNVIDVHIKNLRKKLNNKEFIKNVRGFGYTIKK